MTYSANQKIRVRHLDATGRATWYDGEILDHIKDDVYRVTFGGFGLRFLIQEKDIQDAQQPCDAQVQTRPLA